MIISNEQADYLIHLKKKILQNDNVLENLTIAQEFPMNLRYELVSEEDDEFTFLWVVTQSAKNTLKISLHYQEDESKVGLLRVDYYGTHQNPFAAKENLPDKFRPYIGKFFSYDECHVHYHVEGYKPLAWAVPIADSEMGTTEITETNVNQQIISAILDFAKIINIETKITINPLLL